MNRINVATIDGAEINGSEALVLRDACGLVLYKNGKYNGYQVNVYLVSDEEIRELNKKHRSIDKETDVLSFPMDTFDPETGLTLAGEIVISAETASAQAEEIGHSYERELFFLCAHGMLHLIGHDHEAEADEEKMTALQREYIAIAEADILVDSEAIRKIIKKTTAMLPRAYAPYSGFKVASAVLAEDNKLYFGVNVENISYGATACAERNAVSAAAAAGNRHIKLITVAAAIGSSIFPCGICRQVIAEFGLPWTKIIIAGSSGSYSEYRLSDLLPHAFTDFKGE